MALCPYHKDKTRSLMVGPTSGYHCFGCGKGGSIRTLAQDLGVLPLNDEYFGRRPVNNGTVGISNNCERGRIVAVYTYRDECGMPLYDVVRFDPKTFMPRRYVRYKGQFIGRQWGKGERQVMYRLPELMRRADDPVIVVEGEKDADRLYALKFMATTYAFGVASWRHTDTRCLTGRDVYLIPDNDEAGDAEFRSFAGYLGGKARRVNVVQLRDSEVRLGRGGDVSDWLDFGHTRRELQCMLFGL